MNNVDQTNSETVAQLAISHPGALAVFTKYKIDYCCGGQRSIADACRKKGLDAEKIKAEIRQASYGETAQTLRPQNWSSVFLIDYIIQNHHAFVRKEIPELQAFLSKVCNAHGNDVPALLQIRQNFVDLSQELLDHMEKEELILFPAIKRLEAQNNENHPLVSTLQNPVLAMEHEHVIAGNLVKQIQVLSNDYTPPDFACPTFRITFKKLQAFDQDLMMHIHLENNILFARIKQRRG